MQRRAFLAAVGFGVLGLPLAAVAQQKGKVYRIGILFPGTPPPPGTPVPVFDTLRKALRDLGYVEGQSIVFEIRRGLDADALTIAAEELVRARIDLLLASTTPSALAAKKATATIPIIIVNVRDPVGLGFVQSLARPGGNITGVAETPSAEVAGKLLELLKEVVPDPSRIAVVWNSATFGGTFYLDALQKAAPPLKVALYPIDMRGADDFDRRFEAIGRERIQGAVMLPDATFWRHRSAIFAAAAKQRVAVIYGTPEFVRVGGLMGYGSNIHDNYRRAATYIDKIIRGAQPRDLPVEQPTKLEFVINLKTAKALDLTIPPSLMLRADQVIE